MTAYEGALSGGSVTLLSDHLPPMNSLFIDIQFGRLTPKPNCRVAAGMSLIPFFNAARASIVA